MLLDGPHPDLRRARAAAVNIVPTSTGAAEAVGKVIPSVAGKIMAMAVRVPVPTGSMTELTVITDKAVTAEEANAIFKEYADGPFKGVMEFSTAPLVSSDIIGNEHSCIFDSGLTLADGNLLKVVGWYDNEAGYSARLAELTARV
jgi:glyceraldehyde 3-phosphate dehydrogenase